MRLLGTRGGVFRPPLPPLPVLLFSRTDAGRFDRSDFRRDDSDFRRWWLLQPSDLRRGFDGLPEDIDDDLDSDPPPPALNKLDWLFANRAMSSLVAGLETAGSGPPLLSGLQLRHRPCRTRPWSVIGIILNSFLLKHLRPHVTHSPRFRRWFSSSDWLSTDPRALKSVPSRSMVICCYVVRII